MRASDVDLSDLLEWDERVDAHLDGGNVGILFAPFWEAAAALDIAAFLQVG